jgi:GGDEF domain-containing protein
MGRVDPTETALLAQFGRQRYGSFSEAAGLLVGALSEAVPGTLALTRLEPGERDHRVIEVRGQGVQGLTAGVTLAAVAEGLDPDAIRVLGAREWISRALEASNGQIVGVLCAADSATGVFRPEHEAQLGVAARLLSHEHESIELRSKLRRLRGIVNVGPTVDPATGLPNRESFLQLLEHEWELTQRGTVQSMLLTCRVLGDPSANGSPAPRTSLALKVAAEVLEGSARTTDRVGRVGDSTLGAILIGCRPEDTPTFVARYLSALDRVVGDRPLNVEVACGVQPLDAASSPEEVLGLAEAAAIQHQAPEARVSTGVASE